MRHDLYRHVEMELFVPVQHIVHAAAFIEWTLRRCGGETPPLPKALVGDFRACDPLAEIETLQDTYVHDYLIAFRRVSEDDALVSMTSGTTGEARYAISLTSYQRNHAPFLRVARFLAATMAQAYQARPHWGKICPLRTDEIAALYPELRRFRAHCAAVDPGQVFVNEFARQALGF